MYHRLLSRLALLVVAIVFISTSCTALDNGLGIRPQMGWNSWYDVLCMDAMNETTIKQTADLMVSLGLHSLGYEYINMDDCWAEGRDGQGVVYPDYRKFPSGIKALANYIHSRGLKFGVYTDRGTYTCGGRPGSKNYEKIDAMTYASWGIDYLKEDSCYAQDTIEIAAQEYSTMRDALNSTGRPIFFSLCGWATWYAPMGRRIGNSWRIGPDDHDWYHIIYNINVNSQLSTWSGKGGWNDPCLLVSSLWNGTRMITERQSRTQFNMWAIMSSPLLISGTLINISPWDLETYSNYEVISVNQDPLGHQGIRLLGNDLIVNLTNPRLQDDADEEEEYGNDYKKAAYKNGTQDLSNVTNVWGRPLIDGSWAVVFINVDAYPRNITCDYATCLQQMGFWETDTIQVRDLWRHVSAGRFLGANGFTAYNVEAEGGSVMLKMNVLAF